MNTRYELIYDRSERFKGLWVSPGLYGKVGWRNVKFSFQLGMNIAADRNQTVTYNALFCRVGVGVSIFNADAGMPDD